MRILTLEYSIYSDEIRQLYAIFFIILIEQLKSQYFPHADYATSSTLFLLEVPKQM